MNVLIIGSGGREHALCVSCKKSENINKIFCLPGNAGTDLIAKNISIDVNNFEEIINFVKIWVNVLLINTHIKHK